MNYVSNTAAMRAITLASTSARNLTAQGDPAGLGQTFKDLSHSTPAAPIVAAKRLRDEKINGIVHQVVVITFSMTFIDSVTNEPYACTFTGTVKFPKKYTSNENLATLATSIWSLLASTGTAGTAGIATTASQLENALLGALN